MDWPTEDDFNARMKERLKAIRAELKWSQRKMAEQLHHPYESYKKYENRSAFPLFLLPRLIAATDQPYSYWLFGQGKADGHVRTISLVRKTVA